MKEPKKPFTTVYKVYKVMKTAIDTKSEVVASNIVDARGEQVTRSTLSMYVNKISARHFPNVVFYTRTNIAGDVVVGVNKGQPIDE